FLHELVARHELQHTETMLQTMRLGNVLPNGWGLPDRVDGDGLGLVEVPAGPAVIGAPAEGFAYDNERPRHEVPVPSFHIGRTPVTNATWLHFCEGYRVLRGGSCATDPRVATPHFRNWDLPARRQLFSGVRLAA